LRHQLELDLAGAVRLLEMVRVDLSRVRADELPDAARLEQRGDADLSVARVVVDDREVPRSLRDQRVDQLLGDARAAESSDEDRRAVANVGERGLHGRRNLVDHVRC
jgi:hypothetical protein